LLVFLQVAILYLEVPAVVYRADAYFLDSLAFKSCRKRNLDLPAVMKPREAAAHRYYQEPIFDIDCICRENEVEQTALLSIVRHLDVLKTVLALLGLLDEVEKRLEATVSYLQGLLRYASLKQSVVLVFLADMVVLLIVEEFFLLEVVLPDVVESHIIQIIAVLAHFPEYGVLFLGEFSDYI
jgi:hypothetical protein